MFMKEGAFCWILLLSPIALLLIQFDTLWKLSRSCLLTYYFVISLSTYVLDLGLGLGQTASAPPPLIHH